jgi:TPR repeat protein
MIVLGKYYQAGIPKHSIAADPVKAADYFAHAASYFGNEHAQYLLAKAYLSGTGVKRKPRIAVKWLWNAHKKQHAPSQALLARLLWEGKGTKRNRKQAMNMAFLALDNASSKEVLRIGDVLVKIISRVDMEKRLKSKMLANSKRAASAGGNADKKRTFSRLSGPVTATDGHK